MTDRPVVNYDFERAFYDRFDANELMREAHLTPELLAADAQDLLGL